MQFGVIGGTGFYSAGEERGEPTEVATPYGAVEVSRVKMGGVEIAFVARHGGGHTVPPHRVNYRGNIWALREMGVRNILTSAAVGSMSEEMPPGSLVRVDQFLDFTRGRPGTFFDGETTEGVVHVDLTEPYCPHLRRELGAAAEGLGEKLAPTGTYVCAEGPRFETPAEIRMFKQLGGELVGMTSVPEVVLAREVGICYATVAVVTNWAAGMSAGLVEHDGVSDFMGQQTPRVRALFARVIEQHMEGDCVCRACRTG